MLEHIGLIDCDELWCVANTNGACWVGGCSVKVPYRTSTSTNYTCGDAIEYGGYITHNANTIEGVLDNYMNKGRSNGKTVGNYYYKYYRHLPPIMKVIFNNPAIIVFWADNTKTVVKKSDKDEWDPEKGLAMAIVKKLFTRNQFLKMIPKEQLEATDSEVQDKLESELDALLKAANEGKVDITR